MVPQIVHPVMLQSGCRQDGLKFLPDRRLEKVAAIRVIEHQSGEFTFIPQIAHLTFLCLLIRFMLLQHFHHKGSGSDYAGFAVLQGSEYIILTLDPRLHQLLLDVDHTVLKVHTVPGEPDNLSDPHSREDRRQEQGLKGIAFQRFEEALLLRGVQRRHLLFYHLRQNAGTGWIAFEILHPDSHVQGPMQDTVNALDILGAALFCPEFVIRAK